MATAMLTGNRTLEVTDFMSPATRAANNEPPKQEPVYEAMTTSERRARLKEIADCQRETAAEVAKAEAEFKAAKAELDDCELYRLQRKVKLAEVRLNQARETASYSVSSLTLSLRNDAHGNVEYQEAYDAARQGIRNAQENARGEQFIAMQKALNHGLAACASEPDPVAAIRKLCAELKVRI